MLDGDGVTGANVEVIKFAIESCGLVDSHGT